MKPNWPLLALAVGAFGIGTTEFSPMGLLPVIASGVGVSIPAAGLLVSAYAAGVLVGAPIMTLALARLTRKTALILLMGIFVIGNLLSAIAPDYALLMAARIVTSFNHGAFFGIGAVVATSLVPADKRASAVATMFMGLTIANIGGVPAATWIGQQIGWRMAFGATALLGVATMIALAAALPRGEAGRKLDLRTELAALSRPAVLAALGTTVMGSSAMFVLFTYIAPILAQLAGASAAFTTGMLVLVGIGFTIGNALGGKLADRSIDRAAMIFLGLIALISLLFPLLATSHVGAAVAVLIWGIATFGIVPPVQMRVMQAAHDAPGLASAINIGAFNLGNAIGAAVGGAMLAAGLSYAALPVAGAVLAGLGLLIVVLARRSATPVACAV
jgi:DHA1 family inner membrane transport protein